MEVRAAACVALTGQMARTWSALVRYQRKGLQYEHWVNGELLEVAPMDAVGATTGDESSPTAGER